MSIGKPRAGASPRKEQEMTEQPGGVIAATEHDQDIHRSHHRILSLAVAGGFLDGTKLEFSDGLNCVIGGRGTGKTTVLEFIRYILGMMPDPADSRPRSKAIEGHVRGNLSSGTIHLEVETKHGTRYRAERPWGDDVQVLDSDGDPVPVSLDRDLVFKADIYSQNEIEEIATNLRFQLSLIDKFAEESIRTASADIQKAKRAIEQSSLDLRNLDHRIREIQDVVPEIEVVGKRLQEMQVVEGADAQLINAAHAHKALRTREAEAIADLRNAVGTAAAGFKQFVDSVAEDCATAIGDGFREGPNGALFVELETAIEEFVGVFRDAVPKIQSRYKGLASNLDSTERRLAAAHARQEQQYREIIARSTQEKQRAAERAKLQQRHLALTKSRQELDALLQKRKALEGSHRQMNTKLSELRDRRFRLRKEVAERLSAALKPTIRVSITQAGDRSGYEALLKDMLKGSGLQYNRIVLRIVESLSPEELSRIVRKGDAARLAEDGGIAEDQALRIITHLQDSDHIGKLETVDLEDEPLIALKDGADFKNSADLSTGQRCTVILPILLLESERPLLIDQPEDNLDNAFVYDTIVKNLREAKGSRQLIFVTHNPNIPVLGEAERVFVFTSDGRHGAVSHVGTVDDVKGQIEHLLEGGKEAFVLRMQKYGH
ncbi:MAG: AAA family ATPase [Pseudorhodoplanes sp.]|nr:AAA family ATPase [Pseudorhodoplanes sp.]